MTLLLFATPNRSNFADVATEFEKQGGSITWATSGRQALKAIGKTTVDLVLTDENLGDMTGLELVERLVAVNPMVNCAAVSSLPKNGDRQMKVAISSTGKNLESTIDERFGRCRYFIIVETDDMSFDVVDNTNTDLTASAGIQAATFVASTGSEAVITGNCGPKAMQVFDATNINIILGQYGVIKDVVEKFKSGELSPSIRGNVPEKSGAAQTASAPTFSPPGSGGGGGRGMGGGGGRGMGGGGRGMGMSGGRGMGRRCQRLYDAGSPGFQNTAGNLTREQELAQLQHQTDELKKQMEAIQSKMKSLA